jgi:hypothetical protein
VTTECGRTDLIYCTWGSTYYTSSKGWQGGCFRIDDTSAARSKCTSDNGKVAIRCGDNTLEYAKYCYYLEIPSIPMYLCALIGGGSVNNEAHCSSKEGEIVDPDVRCRDNNTVVAN